MSFRQWLAERWAALVGPSPQKLHSLRREGTLVAADVLNAYVGRDGTATIDVVGGERWTIEPGRVRTRTSPGRLPLTAKIRQSHKKQMQLLTRHTKIESESELRNFVAPTLFQWCASSAGLTILELGPAYTTAVAERLAPVLRAYTAADFSEPYLRKQRQFLAEFPELLARTNQILANTYDLLVPDASFDLVFASCHPPLVSASIEDKRMVLDKLHAALRPNGVLAIFPWYFGEQPVCISRYMLRRFQLRRAAYLHGDKQRIFLCLEKR